MNNTPTANRIHIGLFGRRNAGKSSILNAITNQNLSIVSDVAGTTTDPVSKAMELQPLGPVVLIDTPGIDDVGELGKKRIDKTYQVLRKVDLALLVIDSTVGKTADDLLLEKALHDRKIPFFTVYNKCDLTDAVIPSEGLPVSCFTGKNITRLKETLVSLYNQENPPLPIISDLVAPLDTVILVVPLDKAAPKGRLILPQQQTIRELLDTGAISIVVRDTELAETLKKLPAPPKLVVTDSQIFHAVNDIVPPSVDLTSFSILMARHKGNFKDALAGIEAISSIHENSRILISEGCSHHRQCGDIGTEKLPKLLCNFIGKSPIFEWTSGTEFPADLSPYHMVIHCGGCMLNQREMQYRYACAKKQNVPMTNYGLTLAYVNGILERCIHLFH